MLSKSNNYLPRFPFSYLILVFFCLSVNTSYTQTVPNISDIEFSTMIREMSENSGYFRGDSWVTNELTYLDVLETIEKHNIKGGVYLGVAPEQNFTYIAAIRPELVFLVDIRAQNKMQHLIFKILFEKARTRTEFLSLLFSMPLSGSGIPGEKSDVNEIVNYLEKRPQSKQMFEENLSEIIFTLNRKYRFNLTEWETSNIEFVFEHFYTNHLNTTNGPWRRSYPTLAEIFTDRDQRGKQLNIFNSRDDFLFVKDLHQKNRIIPLTGDYGNNDAMFKVAEYLKKYKLTVTAQYVSNVEQYLMNNSRNWDGWIKNIENLPYTDKTVFIRWLNWNYYNQETRLQYYKTFLEYNKNGEYYRYYDLLTKGYIK